MWAEALLRCILALTLALTLARGYPPAPVLSRSLLVAALLVASPGSASADVDPGVARDLSALTARGPYLRLFATAMVGEGLRFNNPYRLSKQLGEAGESLSLTAPYSDVAAAIAIGAPDGIQHGFHLAWSEALSGVPQTVVTPSYVALYRGPHRYLIAARAGVPILLSPDANAGVELAMTGAYFLTAGIGAAASLIGSGYYGAGTREVSAAFYPVLSLQLGLIVDYEILP